MNTLSRQLSALIETDHRWLPVLSNASALLMQEFDHINWAGFYLLEDAKGFCFSSDEHHEPAESGRLILGPFQGKPACIPEGSRCAGRVCGSSGTRNQGIIEKLWTP